MITYHQLRTFLVIVRTGSLTKAARELNATQPTVSLQLHALQKFLQTPLLDRSGNGFRLTIPAATTERTLRVYIGVLHAQANFTASLSEKSSMIYSDTAQSDANDMKNIMYVIHFEASSSTQYLTVKLIVRYSYNGGMVTLQAATLQ